ncbi:hypothetical protein CSC82_13910 [Rhodobacteraceae bacterium 4F10]|nr:hypothetical protein CSC82_13910 [Rhodobacteraceae bacterium 4F10]
MNSDVELFFEELIWTIDFSEIEDFVGDTFGWYSFTPEFDDFEPLSDSDLSKFRQARRFACMSCSCESSLMFSEDDNNETKAESGEAELLAELKAGRAMPERNEVELLAELRASRATEKMSEVFFEGFLNVDGLRYLADRQVEPAYAIAKRRSEPFSRIWYLAEIANQIDRLSNAEHEYDRLWSVFFIGRYLNELHWQDKHWQDSLVGKQASISQDRRVEASGLKSKQQRIKRLEKVMGEIEKLSNSFPEFSEELIVRQAFDNATSKVSNMPKSKKTLDDYETTLRSDEPFKSRYEAVFGKNA